MAKPFGNGNTDNSTSYKYKTIDISGHYVAAVPDVSSEYNAWSPTSSSGTPGNDFFYVRLDNVGDHIDYSLAGPTISGGKGADQVILTQDATVGDAFFTYMSSLEVLKLANGEGSSVTLDSQALETGIKEVTGGNGNDTISFGNAYDFDPTDVKVYGADGDDVISAGEGNDVLAGGSGNDVLNGEAGADVLTGGTGEDALTGGEGADAFAFGQGSGNATDVIDEITDLGLTDTIKTGIAGNDGVNYVEISGQDFGAGTASLEEIISAANTAFTNILNSGATQYAVVENGSTDAANTGTDSAATSASYLVIDWNGDNTADQAILLTGIVDISTEISSAMIIA